MSNYKSKLVLIPSIFLFFIVSCSSKDIVLEVQKPAIIDIPLEIKKIFIDPKLISSDGDFLDLKSKIILALVLQLNSLGRYDVSIGPIHGVDLNRETVGVIQGDIISSGEVDKGKVTETTPCAPFIILKGGPDSCKKALDIKAGKDLDIDIKKGLATNALNVTKGLWGTLFSLAAEIKDAVRFYRYDNITFSAQTNFSFSLIGKNRETLVIRSDNTTYGRRVKIPDEYTYLDVSNGGFYFIANRSKPDEQVIWTKWGKKHSKIVNTETKEKIIDYLVDNVITGFIQSVSPFKSKLKTEVASGGNADVLELIKKGLFLKAREKINSLGKKESEDIYNLGLTFEASAGRLEDYEYAYQLYHEALTMSPSEGLYAQGVGRMELRLIEAKKLKIQTLEK